MPIERIDAHQAGRWNDLRVFVTIWHLVQRGRIAGTDGVQYHTDFVQLIPGRSSILMA